MQGVWGFVLWSRDLSNIAMNDKAKDTKEAQDKTVRSHP